MSGATIFIEYVKDGKAVFSEQMGKGHSHSPVEATVDQEAVAQAGGVTTMELHLPADRIPFQGDEIPFIAAFSDSPDLTTYHGDNHDSGTLTFP